MQKWTLNICAAPLKSRVPGPCFPLILKYLSMVLLFWQVDRIKLSHDHTGYGSGFFVEEVEVEVPARQDRVKFPCRCWLAQDVDDGKIEREMFAVTPLPSKWSVFSGFQYLKGFFCPSYNSCKCSSSTFKTLKSITLHRIAQFRYVWLW